MLPPLRIIPTLRPKKRSRYLSKAANPAAPAPSTTVFSISSSKRTASSISSSSTSRMSSTNSRIMGRVSFPGVLTAIPSAIVDLPQTIGSPWRALSIEGKRFVCTPIILI